MASSASRLATPSIPRRPPSSPLLPPILRYAPSPSPPPSRQTPTPIRTSILPAARYRLSSSSSSPDDDVDESPTFDRAVGLFNAGDYHRCHDVVEELWYVAEEPVRTVLHGVLQCAVGFHHLFNQNHRGAMMELGEGLCKLRKMDFEHEGPFFLFEKEVSAVLEFLYQTQKELAAYKEKKLNATYIISIARKLGCSVFLLPEDIIEVNSQLISNMCTDALSAEKYYYFICLMGRKASHVALECTLQSHPNMVILGEEVAASKLTIFDITKQICDAVQARAEQDKNHGVILIPEGLVESIPELYALLQEIHGLHGQGISAENISVRLSPWASALFEFLPHFIRKQLLLHPESDDSAQLSQIETEKLLAQLVETEINKRLKEGTYKGKKLSAICHFFGYQARGSLPSKFDCDYAYVLGHICYHILAAGLNGYMATVTNLKNPVNKWKCGAAPITAMMTVKRWARGPGATSIGKPAIHPAIVDLKGKAYELLRQNASSFLLEDIYRNPGPLQFEGPGADAKAFTLSVEDQDYMGRIKLLQEYLDKVKSMVKPGCSQEVLKAALSAMASVTDVLSVMSSPSFNSQLPQ